MSRTRIMDIVTLTREGWRPYEMEPESQVYEKLKCPFWPKQGRYKERPFWFVRDDVFCCIGCSSHCTLKTLLASGCHCQSGILLKSQIRIIT